MKTKDLEIARLRRELEAERAAHAETRRMLADLITRPVAPTPLPIVPWTPPVYPSPVYPSPVVPYDPMQPWWPMTWPWDGTWCGPSTTSDRVTVGDPPFTSTTYTATISH